MVPSIRNFAYKYWSHISYWPDALADATQLLCCGVYSGMYCTCWQCHVIYGRLWVVDVAVCLSCVVCCLLQYCRHCDIEFIQPVPMTFNQNNISTNVCTLCNGYLKRYQVYYCRLTYSLWAAIIYRPVKLALRTVLFNPACCILVLLYIAWSVSSSTSWHIH